MISSNSIKSSGGHDYVSICDRISMMPYLIMIVEQFNKPRLGLGIAVDTVGDICALIELVWSMKKVKNLTRRWDLKNLGFKPLLYWDCRDVMSMEMTPDAFENSLISTSFLLCCISFWGSNKNCAQVMERWNKIYQHRTKCVWCISFAMCNIWRYMFTVRYDTLWYYTYDKMCNDTIQNKL